MSAALNLVPIPDTEQLTTFYVGSELFGIDVMQVQEVTGQPNVIPVPRAPVFIKGLINLRGQIATAIGLNELFSNQSSETHERMSVVCRIDGALVSLVVDSIGDVVEMELSQFERTPDTLPANVRKFIKGIYKMNGRLMSVIDIEKIFEELFPKTEITKK